MNGVNNENQDNIQLNNKSKKNKFVNNKIILVSIIIILIIIVILTILNHFKRQNNDGSNQNINDQYYAKFTVDKIDLSTDSEKDIFEYIDTNISEKENIVITSSDDKIANIVDGKLKTTDVIGCLMVTITLTYNDSVSTMEVCNQLDYSNFLNNPFQNFRYYEDSDYFLGITEDGYSYLYNLKTGKLIDKTDGTIEYGYDDYYYIDGIIKRNGKIVDKFSSNESYDIYKDKSDNNSLYYIYIEKRNDDKFEKKIIGDYFYLIERDDNISSIKKINLKNCKEEITKTYNGYISQLSYIQTGNNYFALTESGDDYDSYIIDYNTLEFIKGKEYGISNRYVVTDVSLHVNDSKYLMSYRKKDNKKGIIDYNGKTIIPFEYKEIYTNDYKDLFVAVKNGSYGVIDVNNKIILPFDYDGIEIIDDYFVTVKDEKTSVLNSNLKEIYSYDYNHKIEFEGAHFYPKGLIGCGPECSSPFYVTIKNNKLLLYINTEYGKLMEDTDYEKEDLVVMIEGNNYIEDYKNSEIDNAYLYDKNNLLNEKYIVKKDDNNLEIYDVNNKLIKKAEGKSITYLKYNYFYVENLNNGYIITLD